MSGPCIVCGKPRSECQCRRAPTVAEMFAGYEKQVVPATASPNQRIETRRTFYCAFFACLGVLKAYGNNANATQEEGERMLEALDAECRRFAQAVTEGNA